MSYSYNKTFFSHMEAMTAESQKFCHRIKKAYTFLQP